MSDLIAPNISFSQLKNFEIKTLKITSQALKKNIWRDSHQRFNLVLFPKAKAKEKAKEKNYPVVFFLAGFAGNGPHAFVPKVFVDNMVEVLDKALGQKKAPQAIYIFVDAMTFWGGSQFINSSGMGCYEDFILKELVPAVKNHLPVSTRAKDWCVMGGSSGGYGALHLGSQAPDIFSYIGAIAPDSFFEQSLLPEIYTVAPLVKKAGGVSVIAEGLRKSQMPQGQEAFKILNAIAMGFCYSGAKTQTLNWPINDQGELNKTQWKKWLKHDPLYFLPKRKESLQKIKKVYLDVGQYDQFHLQYGSRQIHKILRQLKVPTQYQEFEGHHFDIGARRIEFFQWLRTTWRQE